MPSEFPTTPESNNLIIRPSTELVTLPNGGSQTLSEIISRSLAHIQTSRVMIVTERRAGEEREFEIAPGVCIVMCWIPPGEFLMGSPEDEKDRYNDETQHLVEITQGFWLAKTQTTQAEWGAVVSNNPRSSHFKGGDLPVERVSWLDICGDESRMGGFLGAINRTASAGERFDLPTEAQWEYAARAGTIGPRYDDLDEISWLCGKSGGKTHPGGQKRPNAWGLHDMLGNVWEWCADWHDEYPDGVAADPAGPSSGSGRVVRGGSWIDNADGCRAANRPYHNPTFSNGAIGFRPARSSVS
jgi:formylglycine-generating enzyme required for sulfatase activity